MSRHTRLTKIRSKLGVFGRVDVAALTVTNPPNQESLNSAINFTNANETGRNDKEDDNDADEDDNLNDNIMHMPLSCIHFQHHWQPILVQNWLN